MATIAFAYRSTKKEAPIQVRLLYRLEGSKKRFSIYSQTKFKVQKVFWDKYQDGKKFQGDNNSIKIELDNFKNDISDFILNEYDCQTNKELISKEWLKNIIHDYYNPKEYVSEISYSNKMVEYIDTYLKLKTEISNAQKTKWGVIQKKLQRFEKAKGKQFLFKDVDEVFLKDFKEYYDKEEYSQNTAQREFNFIKTLCYHAKTKGIETSPELSSLSLKKGKVEKIFLNPDEIKAIQKLKDLGEAHDNARDWLLISCYTGQRISDFMRFTKKMIRIEDGVPLLEFKQVKTGTKVTIPILPEVENILNKRDGEFPRKISDQRYNEYIKKVCEKAKVNELIEGKIQKNISDVKNETKMRSVKGVYEKWELITSHVGRRSFSSNYYGQIATPYLINITGHSSEVMFLNYISKSQKEISKQSYEKFKTLGA